MGENIAGTTGLSHSTTAATPGDAELIVAVRSGDSSAYAELWTRHHTAVLRYAQQFGASGAEDLVSEAFARLLRVLKSGGGPDMNVRPYLLTTVKRIRIDIATRYERRVGLTAEDSELERDAPRAIDAEEATLEALEARTVWKAYAALPERWQTVLWHTLIEERPPAEVAPILGSTPNAVAALSMRAREGLRQAFLQAQVRGTDQADCHKVLRRLGSWERGALSARESAQVQRHLDECDRCRAAALEIGDLNRSMRAVVLPIILGGALLAEKFLRSAASAGGVAAGVPGVGVATSGAAASGQAGVSGPGSSGLGGQLISGGRPLDAIRLIGKPLAWAGTATAAGTAVALAWAVTAISPHAGVSRALESQDARLSAGPAVSVAAPLATAPPAVTTRRSAPTAIHPPTSVTPRAVQSSSPAARPPGTGRPAATVSYRPSVTRVARPTAPAPLVTPTHARSVPAPVRLPATVPTRPKPIRTPLPTPTAVSKSVSVTVPTGGTGRDGFVMVTAPRHWVITALAGPGLSCRVDSTRIGHCVVPMAQFAGNLQPRFTVSLHSSSPGTGESLVTQYLAVGAYNRQVFRLD